MIVLMIILLLCNLLTDIMDWKTGVTNIWYLKLLSKKLEFVWVLNIAVNPCASLWKITKWCWDFCSWFFFLFSPFSLFNVLLFFVWFCLNCVKSKKHLNILELLLDWSVWEEIHQLLPLKLPATVYTCIYFHVCVQCRAGVDFIFYFFYWIVVKINW